MTKFAKEAFVTMFAKYLGILTSFDETVRAKPYERGYDLES